MKKYLLYFLLFGIFLICPHSFVYASNGYDDSNNDGHFVVDTSTIFRDDLGRFMSGYVHYEFTDKTNDWTYKTTSFISGDNISYIYLIKSEVGSNTAYYLAGLGSASVHENKYNIASDGGIFTDEVDSVVDLINHVQIVGINSNHIDNVFFTTLPIFDESSPTYEDDVANYINSGDTSGAINQDDLADLMEFDENLELPKNLKTSGKLNTTWVEEVFHFNPENRHISVSWDYPDEYEKYQYQVQLRFSWEGQYGKTGITEWIDYETAFYSYTTSSNGSPRKEIIFTGQVLDDVFSLLNVYWGEGLFDVKYVEFRVRNICGNGVTNWVRVRLNKDGSSYAYETDDDGDIIEDSEDYDGSDVNEDSETISIDGDFSLDSILSYIKGGFGLLGDGGVISLMSQTFLYLPASIWTLLKYFVSMMIIIMLIKLVKDVIF